MSTTGNRCKGKDVSDERSVKSEGPSSEAECQTREALSSLQVSEEEDSNEEDVLDEGSVPSSQFLLSQFSQTDEHIRILEKEGELGQVVGSQSMLSQELIHSSQSSAQNDEDEPGFQLSQPSESSTALARHLGLLLQEDNMAVNTAAPVATEKTGPLPVSVTESDEVSEGIETKTPPPATVPKIPITDTPFRESECFGSLLEAVEKVTREEEMNAKMVAWQHNVMTTNAVDEEVMITPRRGRESRRPTSKRKCVSSPTRSNATPSKKSRKTTTPLKKEQEHRKSRDVAKRAAALAGQTITDPEMAKKLLLSMALVRKNPRSVPAVLPSRGATVPEGFFWAHYPPLEGVLKKHMAKYYDLSTTKCQSAQQQSFNNDLVIHVRGVAKERGWRFHPTFTDKSLRDRIRCYYKTHIQNAKKRLRTMVRNPTKEANARHLCAHLDLIEQHKNNDSSDEGSYNQERGTESPKSKVISSKSEARQVSMGSFPSRENDSPLPTAAMKAELTAEV